MQAERHFHAIPFVAQDLNSGRAAIYSPSKVALHDMHTWRSDGLCGQIAERQHSNTDTD